jgi:hypothetical protein
MVNTGTAADQRAQRILNAGSYLRRRPTWADEMMERVDTEKREGMAIDANVTR